MELGEQLKGEGKTQEMTDLIQKVRTILKFMSKAKAAKLVCVFPPSNENDITNMNKPLRLK